MVTLYTFRKSNQQITVFRDDTNFAYINYTSVFNAGPDTQPPANTTVNVVCAPGTTDQYTYKTQLALPYAYFTVLHDAIECGYVPPACDIAEKTFSKRDQSDPTKDDGSANLFCTTSYLPITYYLHDAITFEILTSNNTGLFTGLSPGDYYIQAYDANLCHFNQNFTILPFDSVTQTHFKYRLAFDSIDGVNSWELRLIDIFHNYDKTLYPIDINGLAEPVIKKVADPNEDKATAIMATSLTINLEYTGNDFTVEEFIVPEQSWKVELYKNGVLDFQGWLLPDETQNSYTDPPFGVTLTATDGLASLKGNLWGNGSGGQGYGNFQIAQYGLTAWCLLVKQCLDQLGYDYGSTIVLSSLQFNGTYDVNLWLEIGAWSDILYSSSGVPVDTYSALQLLLEGLKLSIVQHKGYFVLFNNNDLFYTTNGLKSTDFQNAIYQFGPTFGNIAETGLSVEQPSVQLIGKDRPNRPFNPPQILNYDKAYNIEEQISFNSLALLYENPSFEIGPVQGELPPGWSKTGTPDIFCNYDPVIPGTPYSGAYDGLWELRTRDNTIHASYGPSLTDYIQLTTPIVIDQPNLKVNLGYQWRANFMNEFTSALPTFALIYTDGTSGNKYVWVPTPGSGSPRWELWTTGDTGIGLLGITGPATDSNWISYSTTSTALPETSVGQINVRIYGPSYWQVVDHALPDGTALSVDIDMLNISVESAISTSVNQTGEIHQTSAVLTLPNANIKQSSPSLFTFPANKRVAGNVFYCPDITVDYSTAIVANTWNFQLKSLDPLDRLPATITKAMSRNYSRQMYKWEGSVKTSGLTAYGVFVLQYHEDKVFIAFSIESQLRSGTANMILIETDDTDAQNMYTYTAIYQNSARSLGA